MRIFRHEVPVNDQWHCLFPVMDPLSVGRHDVNTVEFWSWQPHDGPWPERFFHVYDTDQEIPENVKYWGTAIGTGWHLVEATGDPRGEVWNVSVTAEDERDG